MQLSHWLSLFPGSGIRDGLKAAPERRRGRRAPIVAEADDLACHTDVRTSAPDGDTEAPPRPMSKDHGL